VSAPRELNNVERGEQNFSDSSVYLLADETRGANLIAEDQDQDQKKCSWSLAGRTTLKPQQLPKPVEGNQFLIS
jgi:hypothetical protein